MLTTLMLSFGVPMLLGGDEMGRTQDGNNNAYCQDNEIAWFDWAAADTELQDYTKRLIALRKAHPVFRRRRFLSGAEASELQWFTPAGTQMTAADWSDENALAIALYLDGSDDPDRAEDGTWLLDDDFLVLVNAWWQPLGFTLPATRRRGVADRDRHLRPGQSGRRVPARRRPADRQPPLDRRAPQPAARRQRLTSGNEQCPPKQIPIGVQAARRMRHRPSGAHWPTTHHTARLLASE